MASELKQEIKIDPLKGSENYRQWSFKMENMLGALQLFKYAAGTGTGDRRRRPKDPSDDTDDQTQKAQWDLQEEWDAKELRCSLYIINNVSYSIQRTLDNPLYKTAKDKWDYLKRYEKTGYIETHDTITQFYRLSASTSKNIEDYCIKFETIAARMDSLGAKETKLISDYAKIVLFLENMNELPGFDQWAARKRSEMQASEHPEHTDLHSLLKEAIEEDRLIKSRKDAKKNKSKDAVASGLATDSKGGDSNRGRSKGDKGSGSNSSKACSLCGSDTHTKDKCFYHKPELAPGYWKPQRAIGKFEDADLSKGNTYKKPNGKKGNADAGTIATLASTASTASISGNLTSFIGSPNRGASYGLAAQRQSSNWVVDSGASDHMSNDLNAFTDVMDCHVVVHTAQGKTTATKRGTVLIQVKKHDGGRINFKLLNVLYLPKLFVNLLSAHKLAANGLSVHTAEGNIVMKGTNQEVAALVDTGSHWELDLVATNATAYAVTSETWHARFGHVGYDRLRSTAKQVKGLNDDINKPEHNCPACMQGKAHEVNSKEKARSHEHFLDLIHLDLVGPITPVAADDCNTSLNITDDATRARYCRMLDGKSGQGILQAFQGFERLIERQLDRKIKAIKTDGGHEFYSLIEYCSNKGIRIVSIPPYDPSKLGRAERTNGVIHEMVRSMLIGGKVPQQFWSEAYKTAVHILNRTASKAIGGETPYHMVNVSLGHSDKEPPTVSHLRAYGCTAYVTAPHARRQRGKFNSRAYIGKLVGYGDSHTTYRILVPTREGVIETAHVRFDETLFESVNQIKARSVSSDPENLDDYDDELSKDMPQERFEPYTPRDDPDDPTFAQPHTGEYDLPLDDADEHQSPDQEHLPERARDASTPFYGLEDGEDITPPPPLPDELPPQEQDRTATDLLRRFQGLTPLHRGTASVRGLSELPDSPIRNRNLSHSPTDLLGNIGTGNVETPRQLSPRQLSDIDEGESPDRDQYQRYFSKSPITSREQTPSRFIPYPSIEQLDCETGSGSGSPPIQAEGGIAFAFPAVAEEKFVHTFATATEAADTQGDPQTYKQAMSEDPEHWGPAIAEEQAAQEANQTFTWAYPPKGVKLLPTKYVFKRKTDSSGRVVRYKVRIVAKGFAQKYGRDYQETFAAVAKTNTFRVFIALVTKYGLHCDQMDAVTAFLNPYIDEGVQLWMTPPEGCQPPKPGMVWLLNRTLYGLKQSAREWYLDAARTLIDQGYKRSDLDHCLFFKGDIWVLVYVDDFLIAAPTTKDIRSAKQALSNKYKMKDLGELKYFLGIKVERIGKVTKLSQKAYLEHVLKELGMENCKARESPISDNQKIEPPPDGYVASPDDLHWYQRACGFLMYAAMITRPDFATVLIKLARYLSNPSTQHVQFMKQILRYMKGTLDYAIVFDFSEDDDHSDINLIGWSDSSYADDVTNRRSHSGYVFTVGNASKAPITWQSSLQRIVTLSSTEAELVALTTATQEALWLNRLLGEFGVHNGEPVRIMEDNTSTIALTKNPEHHKGTKHIEVRWYFCREQQLNNNVVIIQVDSDKNIADGMTKQFGPVKQRRFVKQLGMNKHN